MSKDTNTGSTCRVNTSRIIWCVITVLYLGAVAYLCFGHLSPNKSLPKDIFGIPIDKLAHFGMFFPFVITFHNAFHRSNGKAGRFFLFLLLAYILGVFVALGTELLQGTTDYRTADPMDFIADSFGLMTGAVFLVVIRSINRKW